MYTLTYGYFYVVFLLACFSQFGIDAAEMIMSSDIPETKLDNPVIRQFLRSIVNVHCLMKARSEIIIFLYSMGKKLMN